jgi:hypothetical protein
MSLGPSLDPVGMSAGLALGGQPQPPAKKTSGCATCVGADKPVQEAKLGGIRGAFTGLMMLWTGEKVEPIAVQPPNFGQSISLPIDKR